MNMPLKGKVALVTGAGQGIGAAILRALAVRGATLVGTDINDRGVGNIDAILAETGAPGKGIILDVRDEEHIERGIAGIEKEFGLVYALVNNAGITRDNLMLRMKDEEWDAVIETNMKSVFRMSRAVIRGMMKAHAGRIINITSVVGHAGNPGQANYCASKAGIAGLSRALVRELGNRNITVNCVAPGFIDTHMTQILDEKQKEALIAKVPLGRLGTPEDVAAAVGFLASPEAAYISGATIHVNGGMHME
ncbi:MAG: 3-oxoacyl-ACP reductase FabG [Candidatus Accumulibacter sp.]|jgi:3-oxoacyl-[acyl-carrier protein] reductase|nr:3-oxoacyl-ACP reductase FabG [Accumulibacter sp.]